MAKLRLNMTNLQVMLVFVVGIVLGIFSGRRSERNNGPWSVYKKCIMERSILGLTTDDIVECNNSAADLAEAGEKK
jgi:hypothetical protein